MSWQEEVKGKTLSEAIAWFLANVIEGELIDNETYEDVWHPWTGVHKRNDSIKLHRIWLCKKSKNGTYSMYCVDLEEYDDPEEPFFAGSIMSAEMGPWGYPPPPGFGNRPGGNQPRAPRKWEEAE